MTASYQVLARAYRPKSFKDGFLGQEVVCQVLSQAMLHHQLPHAMIFSGTRGIGKTTTARIVARTLNCAQPQVDEGIPLACGKCASCLSLDTDSNLDVLEFDAASNTSVDDIRGILDTLPYRPTLGQYKVILVDEVHMLSKAAFNALLKTLEEPPSHVKFIFATTELHKVPATILSRCMRFELRPLSFSALRAHLLFITTQENIALDPQGLDLIVQAAKGSVRDALSLLDQARHLDPHLVTTAQVRDMLGRAEEGQVDHLLVLALQGDVAATLAKVEDLYAQGVDPLYIAQGMLESVYRHSKKVVGRTTAAEAFLTQLTMPQLQTLWFVVAKGYEDVQRSPLPEAALEMLCLRLMHGAGLTTLTPPSPRADSLPSSTIKVPAMAAPAVPLPSSSLPTTLEELVQLCHSHKEPLLASHLIQDVRLVDLTPPHMVLQVTDHAPRNVGRTLQDKLTLWTQQTWQVSIQPMTTAAASTPGHTAAAPVMPPVQPTLEEQRAHRLVDLTAQAMDADLFLQVQAAFPEAELLSPLPRRHEVTP